MENVQNLKQEVDHWKQKYLTLVAWKQQQEEEQQKKEAELKKWETQIRSEKKENQQQLDPAKIVHGRSGAQRYLMYDDYKFLPMDGGGILYMCKECPCEVKRISRSKTYMLLGKHHCKEE